MHIHALNLQSNMLAQKYILCLMNIHYINILKMQKDANIPLCDLRYIQFHV